MHDPIYIERYGHRTWLKWHRGRRRATDPVFTGRRILEAMTLGTSVEIDLVIHADHGCAILHNLTLDDETTGTGRVIDTHAADLRALQLRDNAGQPIADRIMLLDDLAALLAQHRPTPMPCCNSISRRMLKHSMRRPSPISPPASAPWLPT
ncbi:MAG: hypothetical protein MO852_06290 [Candidatus Devosia euplotis]|nr:hypothetical protein [Candidatus Devosia euplotis]